MTPSATSPFLNYIGEAFTTGSNATSWDLDSVTTLFDLANLNNHPASPELEIESDSSGEAKSLVFAHTDFNSSFNSTDSEITFTANTTVALAPNTTYWVVISDPTGGNACGVGIICWNYNYLDNTPGESYPSEFNPFDGFTMITGANNATFASSTDPGLNSGTVTGGGWGG